MFNPRTYYVIVDVSANNEVMAEFDSKVEAVESLGNMERVSGTTYVLLERTDTFMVMNQTQTMHIQLPEGWKVNEDGTLSVPEGQPKMQVIESDARLSPEFIEWFNAEQEKRKLDD